MPTAVRQYLLLCLLTAFLPTARAAYSPLTLPETWTFTVATPAYNPETGEQLGDFQPGIKVNVVSESTSAKGRFWDVEYVRYGAPPIQAQIHVPDLSKVHPRAYASVREDIDSFPLLKKQLEAETPWSIELLELRKRLLGKKAILMDGTEDDPMSIASSQPRQDGFAWDQMPVEVRLSKNTARSARIVINFWNKGDRHSVVDPRRAYPILRDKLARIEKAFGTNQFGSDHDSGPGINALRYGEELYYLPNETEARLRYSSDEYLILELSEYGIRQGNSPASGQDLIGHVKTSENGELYVADIPMISQGEKGYCVAATLARVLSYYGYPVDMYSVAKLAETERYGTSLDNMTTAMRRVSGTAPLRVKELGSNEPASIRSVIEQGLPIVWLVPGHCRLIIGIHPDTREIVFSDSWGPDHAYKTMPYDEFLSLNRHMYVLEPAQ
ncbi:C39 family peptidase [Ruficoccus amylovorans]|uniref:C39 family peptidase n=1 Tax=Ruficoccus amylovorans TaxID=1804625 RepID=A0A842HHQ6_9BACT|nr:C39 family peptidase [Ruficoccus amylovorans]MBC2595077.1 C39 family peptidase [Ruficoccus amylovorans]